MLPPGESVDACVRVVGLAPANAAGAATAANAAHQTAVRPGNSDCAGDDTSISQGTHDVNNTPAAASCHQYCKGALVVHMHSGHVQVIMLRYVTPAQLLRCIV